MEDKLRRYVDGLFARTAPTKKAVELKEEMLQNLQDKYDDLISEGKTPEAAYNIAIAGIGDVSGLLAELEADVPDEYDMPEFETARQRTAMITAIAVMMIILSSLPIIILDMIGSRYTGRIGVPILFVMVACAVGLLIYNNMTKPRYIRRSNTVVEEFREWQSGVQDRKSLRRAISAALWSVLLAIYFIISFWTDAWHITWVIFVIGASIEAFINVILTLKK
jgi:hypothetical protein